MAGPSNAKTTKAYDDWEVPDAMRTLQRADEIHQNTGLHSAVKRHAKKQLRSLKKIAASKPNPSSPRK